MDTAPDSPRSSSSRGVVVRTGVVIGVGVLVSLAAGLLVGWVTGDLLRGLGRVFTWGMILTAVVGVLLAVRGDRSYRWR